MEENQNFCTACGQILKEDTKFCPACGKRVPGRSPEQAEAEKQQIVGALETRLNWSVGIMLLYSIPFLILGIYVLVNLDGFVDTIWNGEPYQEAIEYYGLTQEELHNAFQYAGVAYLVSSVCGIVASVLCWKRIVFWGAVALCAVSMFTGVMGFFGLFMGLIAFWIILSSKPLFLKYRDRLDAELGKIE